MPGSPQECREHALRCTELADRATNPQEQAMLRSLALSWTRLAAELENAKAFLSAPKEMELDGSELAKKLQLYAAAEAHPNWEVLADGTGIQHVGSEWPNTPRELLEWFLKKGRH